jgi:hypothetical protein
VRGITSLSRAALSRVNCLARTTTRRATVEQRSRSRLRRNQRQRRAHLLPRARQKGRRPRRAGPPNPPSALLKKIPSDTSRRFYSGVSASGS